MPRFISIAKPQIGREEIDAVVGVLKSGILTDKKGGGPYNLKFEEVAQKYLGVRRAFTTNSGTAALHMALLAADVGPGDEVIVPGLSFSATAETVVLTGAKPVFADIDPTTYNLNPASLEKAINSKTKAVIPVHLYGLMADMEAIGKIAAEHDLIVIEDAAQSLGSEMGNQRAGSFGHFACFSFYASKIITTGEGGLVTTTKKEFEETLASIRNHGEGKRGVSERLGHNYRMSEVAAAIGYHQFQRLPKLVDGRRKTAQIFTDYLETVPKLILPREPQGYKHSWNVYTVKLKGSRAGKRNKVVEKLNQAGINAAVYYETPLHLVPLYRRRYGYTGGTLPAVEASARQIFSLPIHNGVTEDDMKYISEKLRRYVL